MYQLGRSNRALLACIDADNRGIAQKKKRRQGAARFKQSLGHRLRDLQHMHRRKIRLLLAGVIDVGNGRVGRPEIDPNEAAHSYSTSISAGATIIARSPGWSFGKSTFSALHPRCRKTPPVTFPSGGTLPTIFTWAVSFGSIPVVASFVAVPSTPSITGPNLRCRSSTARQLS